MSAKLCYKRTIILLFFFIIFTQDAYLQAVNKVDKNGLKQGDWIKTNNLDEIVYKGNFIDDIPVGQFLYYDKGKIKATTHYSDNGTKAQTITYFENGKIMSDGLYVNQLKTGSWRFYNDKGDLISIDNYKDGKRNGISENFYANGALFERTNYKENIKNGVWLQFYSDSSKKIIANYDMGFLNGEAVYFHTNGVIMAKGFYYNNVKNGDWYYYDETEKNVKYEKWDKGNMLIENYLDKTFENFIKQDEKIKDE